MRLSLARCLLAALVLVGSSAVRADEPFVFPTMDQATDVKERHYRVTMRGRTAGGITRRVGRLADGRKLGEWRRDLRFQRETGRGADVFRIESLDVDLHAADGRILAKRTEQKEAGVVETSEAIYGVTHVDVTLTGPGGSQRKRLELPPDVLSANQVHRRLVGEWKEGTQPTVTYSELQAWDGRFGRTTQTLLGRTTYVHEGVAHPAWRATSLSEKKELSEAIVDEDGRIFAATKGAMKAVWTNEPVPEAESAGGLLSSLLTVRGVVPEMLKVERLEVRLTIDPPPEADRPLIAAGAYQDVVAEPGGYRLTLKAQRVPPEARGLGLPLDVQDPAVARHLEPTTAAQSDHAEIVAHAKRVVGDAQGALDAVERIVRWVWAHVKKATGARAGATALEVLRACEGDCTEHAVLVVALCRAIGIPARQMSGLEYLAFQGAAVAGHHAWAEVWLGRWVPVDATIPEVGTSGRYVLFKMDEPGAIPEGGSSIEFQRRTLTLDVLAYAHEGAERVVLAGPGAKPVEPAPQGPR